VDLRACDGGYGYLSYLLGGGGCRLGFGFIEHFDGTKLPFFSWLYVPSS